MFLLRRPRYEIALALLLALSAAVYLAKATRTRGDLVGYIRAGYHAATGADIYDENSRNIWPPSCAVAFVPLAVVYYGGRVAGPELVREEGIDFTLLAHGVRVGWIVLSLVLLGVILRCYVRRLYGRDLRVLPRGDDDLWLGSLPVAVPLLLCLRFVFSTLDYVQITIPLLACMALAMDWFDRRPRAAGWLLAAGAAVKILPVFVLFYALWRRAWGVLAGFAVGGAVVLAGTALWFGPARTLEYSLRYVELRRGYLPVRPSNQAPFAVLDRVLGRGLPGPPLSYDENTYESMLATGSPRARRATTVVLAGLLGAMAVAFARGGRQARSRLLEEALVLLAILYVSPTSWRHYYISMLPAYVVVYAAATQSDWLAAGRRRVLAVLLGVSAVLHTGPNLVLPEALKGYLDYLGVVWIGSLFLFAAGLLARWWAAEEPLGEAVDLAGSGGGA